MALRPTSRFAILLATILGRKRRDREMVQPTRQFGSAYAVTAMLFGRSDRWSVYSCATNHVIADGLSRNRAATLCELLNLASQQRPSLQTSNAHPRLRNP